MTIVEIHTAKKSKFDSKVAAYAFIVIIFAMVIASFVISGMASSADIDLNDFWNNSVAMIVQYALFIGVFFLVCRQLRLKGQEIPRAIDLNKKVSVGNSLIVFLIAGVCLACFMLLIQGLTDVMSEIGLIKECADCVEAVSCWRHQGFTLPQYLMAIFTMCLLPAVIEELLFRGIILKSMMPMGKMVAVIASALMFSLFHLSVEQTLYQFILGLVFAVVALQTGNLAYAMILHFLNNFFAITVSYIFTMDALGNLAWNPVMVITAIGLAVLGAIAIVGLVKAFDRHDERKENPKTARFWSISNLGYFLAIGLVSCMWVLII